MPAVQLEIGDILTLKKPHACGANAWQVYRIGTDIGLRCTACNRRMLIARSRLERRIRLITRGGISSKPHQGDV